MASTSLVDRLTTLADTEISAVDSWIAALVACLDPFYGLVNLGMLPADLRKNVEHGLGLFWAGGVLVHRVVTFAADPTKGALFAGEPIGHQGGGAAAYVAGTCLLVVAISILLFFFHRLLQDRSPVRLREDVSPVPTS